MTVVDLSASEEDQKRTVSAKSVKKSTKKAMQSGKDENQMPDISDMLEGNVMKGLTSPKETPQESEEAPKKVREPKVRSRKYKLARGQVDRTIEYPLLKAVELIQKTSLSRFDGTVSVHLNLTDQGVTKEISFPHPTGKTLKVAIADDKLLKDIEVGKIDFDMLLSTKETMPKVMKVAKILGPKGLMPNAKNGTITDKPEARKKELEGGKTVVKGESKAPLMHVVIGKVSYKTEQLEANVKTLVETLGLKLVKKITLAATMGPGIKVAKESFAEAVKPKQAKAKFSKKSTKAAKKVEILAHEKKTETKPTKPEKAKKAEKPKKAAAPKKPEKSTKKAKPKKKAK